MAGLVRLGLCAALGVTVLAAVIQSGTAARRRLVVLAAPVVAVAALVEWTFGGFLQSGSGFG